MTRQSSAFISLTKRIISSCLGALLLTAPVSAEVTLEKEVKIADNALHFDGKKDTHADVRELTQQQLIDDSKYHYHFGASISAHGDSVKVYKHYVFMTWYRGGKDDRHVMLSRLNTETNSIATIEFPHRHTGYLGDWWIGESHNTIGLAVSPINGTIHMVYDMHGYDDSTARKKFKDDYFRYSYSIAGTADVSDDEFTLDRFVKDTSTINQGSDDYKHLSMTGDLADKDNFKNLTYPKFFTNTDGTLILNMRKGSSNNGAYVFNRYDAASEKWSTFTHFNYNHQRDKGNEYNWGLYGNMKYVNGKLRVGFQQRKDIKDDRYLYQNGIYYAYSNAADGFGDWYNHKDDPMTWPLVNSDEIKIFEPGDLVTTQEKDKVYIVGNFDWTVTEKGDVHFVHGVKDNENNKQVFAHTYRPAGETEFITSTDFSGAKSIYTAGDNLYIIGLANGNPYIEMAKGGTNTFTKVYQGADGNYNHGVVYVHEGKVYYYLMKKQDSGSARPIYLQIIDLGIPKATVSFEKQEMVVAAGYQSLVINTFPSIENPNLVIANVALYLNDEIVSTLNAVPYQWTQQQQKLQNLAVGTYELKAIVTDNSGKTAQAKSMLRVVDPTPSIRLTQTASRLTEGYASWSLDVDASTPIAERTIVSVALFVNDSEVSTESSSSFQWTQENAQLQALPVGTHNLKVVVTDSEGLTAEATEQLVIEADNTEPSVSFAQSTLRLEEGYSTISITATASTTNAVATIETLALYIGDALVSEQQASTYSWTGTSEKLSALSVGSHTAKVIVTDSKGLTAQATMQITVTAKPAQTDNSQTSSSGGGGALNPIIMAVLVLFSLRRKLR